MNRLGLFLYVVVVLTALPLRAEPPSHWAYQSVTRPAIPPVRQTTWPQNALDRFILAQQEARQLHPAPPATRQQWLRRATFDLTGLPPTWEEIVAFERDSSPDAYDKVIDRLLASPRYGERMATHWLDLARYADTHGYHIDSHRDMWRYRDEVIASFARHQPFDQFTIEQLAGDLLPNATLAQRIASGFNRNHMVNFEGGAIPEEYLNKYVSDRVTTTATVWLGQTFECARCHDHKHDPFTMRDFYAFYAFFHNVPEEGIDGRRGNAMPYITAPTHAQADKLAEYDQRLTRLAEAMRVRAVAVAKAQAAWEAKLSDDTSLPGLPPDDALLHLPLDETTGDTTKNSATRDAPAAKVVGEAQWLTGKFQGGLLLDGETFIDAGDLGNFSARDPFTFSAWVFPTTKDNMVLLARADDAQQQRGYQWSLVEGKLQLALINHVENAALVMQAKEPLVMRRWQHVVATYDGSRSAAGIKLYVRGEPVEASKERDNLGVGNILANASLRIGKGPAAGGFRGLLDEIRVYARELSPTEVGLLAGSDPVRAIAMIAQAERTAAQTAALQEYYLQRHDDEYQRLRREQLAIQQARRALLEVCPTTMVMAELSQPRKTFILERGDYQHPTDEVTANTPSALPPLPSGAPRDRLTLARWLVDGRHPLTARVLVNRLWQLHFGQGLVRTPNDFGTAGAAPTHPELLDWLADEFVRSGWNVQHLQRLMLTSATYRQSCRATSEQLAGDPDNLYLARFPRWRLTAEMLRDQALSASGLLEGAIGGPSVFPYQPAGLWEEIGRDDGEYSAQSYTPGHGAELYRRSLYTFWKRTSPPPGMSLFDAPDRETCTVSRHPTNTPLQALVLWNDPTFVEAARVLAERILHADGNTEQRIQIILQRILGRNPLPNEVQVLAHLFERQRGVYRAEELAARSLLAVGEFPGDKQLPAEEVAAWTIVVQTVLSSDEALHRN